MAKEKIDTIAKALSKSFGGVKVEYKRIPRFHEFDVVLPRVVHAICFSVGVLENDDMASLKNLCRLATSHLQRDPDGQPRTLHLTRHGIEEQPRE